ncbi:MAG: type IV pilus modification protein PilV [Wenzhouxiangellaceae bacterium]|nr:type IV pilus modification protein PilV [Wenzhouxiangellaceae bacterium]
MPLNSGGFDKRHQAGVSLIEILITLLILAIGLLGLAALQGFSLQTGQASYQRTQAVNIAYEVADYARANRSTASVFKLNELAAELAVRRLPAGLATVARTDDEVTVIVTWTDGRLEDLEAVPVREEKIVTRI